jgi:uncharacterized membrane protein
VPIIVLVAILGKAHAISSRIVTPLAERLAFDSIIGVSAPRFLAIALIVLFCFITGLLARTSRARRLQDRLEGTILSRIPGYTLIKGIAESVAGTDRATIRQAVLVRIEDAWQIGLLVDRVEPGHVAVFVPGAPDPKSGSVYFLTEDRIKNVDLSLTSALDCVRGAGKGSGAMLGGKL